MMAGKAKWQRVRNRRGRRRSRVVRRFDRAMKAYLHPIIITDLHRPNPLTALLAKVVTP